MLLSMTGYGEGKACTDFGEIRLEVKSVNHRFLDCKINLPKELSFLEPGFREEIKKKVKRGMIFLNLYWEKSPDEIRGDFSGKNNPGKVTKWADNIQTCILADCQECGKSWGNEISVKPEAGYDGLCTMVELMVEDLIGEEEDGD